MYAYSCRRTVKHMKYYFIEHAGNDKTDAKNTSSFTPLSSVMLIFLAI
jgi:hypothetical protein